MGVGGLLGPKSETADTKSLGLRISGLWPEATVRDRSRVRVILTSDLHSFMSEGSCEVFAHGCLVAAR